MPHGRTTNILNSATHPTTDSISKADELADPEVVGLLDTLLGLWRFRTEHLYNLDNAHSVE